jgi:hypothetical protein
MRTQIASLALLALAPAGAAHANPPPAPQKQMDPLAKKITGSDAYIPAFGLRATVSRGFSMYGYIQVDAGLDVPQVAMRKQVEALKPRIINDMREALSGYASLSYVIGEKPNADMVKAKLQRAVDGVLGKDQARVALASVIVSER